MFYFQSTGIAAERASLFSFDDSCFPFRKNVCVHMNKPIVRPEPVLTPGGPGEPDSLASHFYGTVLFDEGKFRMWYVGMSLGLNPDMPPEDLEQLRVRKSLAKILQGPICYAESEDGIRWEKPNLGQLPFHGGKNNNAISFPDSIIHCPTLIKDEDDPDPSRRYKMVYQYYLHTEETNNWPTMRTATSPDGLHWTAGAKVPVKEFVEHCSFYKFNGYYIVNGHSSNGWRKGEGGSDRGRQGFAYISADFDSWLQETAESFALPDPQDPAKRGQQGSYDQVHLGTAPMIYGNVAVGLYSIWHNSETFTEISGDFGLVLSDDGLRYREPVKGHVYLHSEQSLVTPHPDKYYHTVLCQANGFLNVGDETRIYHGRWRNTWNDVLDRYYGEIALAVLPRDRWGSMRLHSDQEEGSLWSSPVTLPQRDFEFRVNAEGVQGIRIELSDEQFRPLAGFSGENGGIVRQDGLESSMEWPGEPLERLAGRKVRIRVVFHRSGAEEPILYAVYGVSLSSVEPTPIGG
ncbi:hypothetical protein FE784_04025 [Paenibacillus hemerocallicola]|uniref:Glycosyl hydrolase family 32 N-terminal domain-containing protein n=1 Tax=Paenibacillus hemerocallicola TaxID=1172614 RepID=A0A5C4TG59_9BACL|nr:hypothetical protein [Paenibacillus hemerocallicola]TNJ67557.1 hypothetical protein FE784_04025 [Paenibacillus hemerocallicola]